MLSHHSSLKYYHSSLYNSSLITENNPTSLGDMFDTCFQLLITQKNLLFVGLLDWLGAAFTDRLPSWTNSLNPILLLLLLFFFFFPSTPNTQTHRTQIALKHCSSPPSSSIYRTQIALIASFHLSLRDYASWSNWWTLGIHFSARAVAARHSIG